MSKTLSNSQKKKAAQALAAAQSKNEISAATSPNSADEGEAPIMPPMFDKKVIYYWSPDLIARQFDCSKFIMLYPAYIDSTITIDQGRRVRFQLFQQIYSFCDAYL